MHYEAMRFWLEVLILVFTTLVNPFFTWWRTREKVANNHIAELGKRIGAIESDKKTDNNRTGEFSKQLEQIKETDEKRTGEFKSQMELIKADFSSIKMQLVSISGEVKHPPSCLHHQGFEDRLDDMNGSIKKLEGTFEGRMKGIGSALDMIQQHLISGGK